MQILRTFTGTQICVRKNFRMFDYASNEDLHNHLSKNLKEIIWDNKILSLDVISGR